MLLHFYNFYVLGVSGGLVFGPPDNADNHLYLNLITASIYDYATKENENE